MLTHFESYEQQDRADLEYGSQLADCQRQAKSEAPNDFVDHSITGDWTPEED